MNEFKNLRKSQRQRLIKSGVLGRVAAKTNKSKATVSRTLAGSIKTPDPRVVRALCYEIETVLPVLKRAA